MRRAVLTTAGTLAAALGVTIALRLNRTARRQPILDAPLPPLEARPSPIADTPRSPGPTFQLPPTAPPNDDLAVIAARYKQVRREEFSKIWQTMAASVFLALFVSLFIVFFVNSFSASATTDLREQVLQRINKLPIQETNSVVIVVGLLTITAALTIAIATMQAQALADSRRGDLRGDVWANNTMLISLLAAGAALVLALLTFWSLEDTHVSISAGLVISSLLMLALCSSTISWTTFTPAEVAADTAAQKSLVDARNKLATWYPTLTRREARMGLANWWGTVVGASLALSYAVAVVSRFWLADPKPTLIGLLLATVSFELLPAIGILLLVRLSLDVSKSRIQEERSGVISAKVLQVIIVITTALFDSSLIALDILSRSTAIGIVITSFLVLTVIPTFVLRRVEVDVAGGPVNGRFRSLSKYLAFSVVRGLESQIAFLDDKMAKNSSWRSI